MYEVNKNEMNNAKYLNETVWATLGSSKIHGIGVIAIRDIPSGTAFTDYAWSNYSDMVKPTLLIFTENEFKKILPEIRSLILDKTVLTEELIFLSPNWVQDLRSWMNHHDSPNTKDFTTIKDIKKGEELTEDFRWFGELHELSKKHYDFIK